MTKVEAEQPDSGSDPFQSRTGTVATIAVMTNEEYLEKMRDPNWYGDQDENGVDLSILRRNLKLTPTERLRRGDRATQDALRIRKNVKRVDPGQA